MTPKEFSSEFVFDPKEPRAMCYVSSIAIVHDTAATAVTVASQLLEPETRQPSNKWMVLQMERSDALVLAASIMALAGDQQWPVRKDFFDLVQQLSAKDQP
jgi:hypothetical protein